MRPGTRNWMVQEKVKRIKCVCVAHMSLKEKRQKEWRENGGV